MIFKEYKFKGNYNRIGIIRFGLINYDICKQENIEGIAIDSSEGEYSEYSCCSKCFENNTKERNK